MTRSRPYTRNEVLDGLAPRVLQQVVEPRDHRRAADPRHAHGAVSDQTRAFELDPVDRVLDESCSGDPYPALALGLEPAARQIHGPARAALQEGVLAFVQAVRRNRLERCLAGKAARFQDEVVVVQESHHDVHRERLGREGAAFEDLSHVGGEADVGAGRDGVRGDGEIVAGTSGHHHVGPRIEGLGDGLPTHLGDDGGGGVERVAGEGEPRFEVLDFPSRQRLLDPFAGDVGVDPGESKAKVLLACDLADDLHRPVDQLSAPRAPGAADDQGNAGAARGGEKLGNLALDHPSRAERLCRAEVGWTRVGGAGVDRDDVGRELHPALERAGIEPVTQGAGGGEDGDHRDGSP